MIENLNPLKEYTVGMLRIYTLSILFLIFSALLIILPYILIWGSSPIVNLQIIFSSVKDGWQTVFSHTYLLRDIFLISLFILIGAVFHELLHAIFWIFFTKRGIKSLRFGISKSDFSPYIHCIEPLPVWVYRIGIILPGIILGILPAITSIFLGNFRLLIFGVFFIWAASGDFIILWLIRNLKSNTLLQDHPVKVGCFVVD